MFTYPTLLISYAYTVLYAIYCILPMPHGHHLSLYLYVHIPYSFLYTCVYKVVGGKLFDYLLDITARLELEAQAFCYTRINIC
jgi:4-hydroxybenzoate polyprenyltransferase